jgi:hypothetical protein
VLGISNGVLYALHGSWAYTTAIQREIGLGGIESEKPGAVQWLLVGSLLAGAIFSAIQRNRFRLAWRPSAAWIQNIIGGALMGFGAFLIPGGNDVLLLEERIPACWRGPTSKRRIAECLFRQSSPYAKMSSAHWPRR